MIAQLQKKPSSASVWQPLLFISDVSNFRITPDLNCLFVFLRLLRRNHPPHKHLHHLHQHQHQRQQLFLALLSQIKRVQSAGDRIVHHLRQRHRLLGPVNLPRLVRSQSSLLDGQILHHRLILLLLILLMSRMTSGTSLRLPNP